MSEESYLNTFAIISLPNDGDSSKIKYEYYSSKSNTQKVTDNNNNLILSSPKKEKTKNYNVKYWIMHDFDNSLKIAAAEYVGEKQLADVLFGPFLSLNELKIYALKYNLKLNEDKNVF